MIQYVVAVAVGALFGSMDKSKPKKRKKFEDGGKTGDKPKIISISEMFMKMDGDFIEWSDMDNAIIMWGRPMDAEDVYNALARKEIYLDEYAPELFVMKEDEDDEEPVELKSDVTIDDIVDAIEDERFMKGDNTYNYNAPFVFDFRYVATDDPYDEQLYFVREHRGGDVRGNYGNYMAVEMDSVEQNPLYGRIDVQMETEDGKVIQMTSEGVEGYTYEIAEDTTGTFEQGEYVKVDEIEEAFDFADVKSSALNIFAHGGVVGEKLSPAEMQKLILDKTGELLDPDTNKFASVAGAMGYAYALFGGYWTKSFAKGGKVSSEQKMRHKHVGKVAERSIKKMDSDDQLSSLREYAQHDIGQKFAERDKALKKAYEDKATFDLPTPRYYTSEFAHGGKAQGYDDKLDESLAMRRGAGRSKQQSRKDRRDESAGMERSMGRRKYASVGTMDKGRRKMAQGGLAIHFDDDYTHKDEIENLLMSKTYMGDNEYLTDYGSSFYVYSDDIGPSGVRDVYDSIVEEGYDDNVELEPFAKGGKTQGYNARLDESLSMRHGAGRKKQQTRKDRRDESAAMERSMGRRKYASVGTMDKGRRTMEKGGEIKVGQKVGLRFDSEYHRDNLDSFVVEKIENGNYSVRGVKNDNTYSVPKERLIIYKYANGGHLSEFDAIERNDIIRSVYTTKGDVLQKVRNDLGKIGMKIVEEDWDYGYGTNQTDYKIWIEPDKEISDAESMAIHRFFKKIDTNAITRNYGDSMEIKFSLDFAKGGMTQGYNARLDESLGMRRGSKRTKKQGYKSRRHESEGMERSMGRRKYASVGTMDKGRRTMEKGGKTGRETITYNVYNIDGNVIRSAESIADFDKGTITLPNGQKFKVKPDLDFTMKFQKTQIKAKDGLEGLVRNIKEFSSPDSAFNLLYADKFAPKEMEKGGTTKKSRKKVSDFDKLAMKVAARYRAEGKSNEEAMEIGRGTAAKVYRQQQGKKGK